MKMESVEDLMFVGMTYTLDFEERVGAEAKKMAEASSDPELKELFEKTVTKSEEYAARLEAAFEKIGREKDTNKNHIAIAMIDEVENMISNTEPSAVRDAALIVAANQQQLYRVASYGSLKTYAKVIGKSDAVADLEGTVEDSKNGDQKFTAIGESRVNQQAASAQVAA